MKRNNDDVDGMLEDIEGFIYSLDQTEVCDMLINMIDEQWSENHIREYFSDFVGTIYQCH